MRTASFQGVKRAGFGVYHPLPSTVELEETVLYYTSENTWPVVE
jgi:hypothetical protein